MDTTSMGLVGPIDTPKEQEKEQEKEREKEKEKDKEKDIDIDIDIEKYKDKDKDKEKEQEKEKDNILASKKSEPQKPFLDSFEEFYKAYPRHVARQEGYRAYCALMRKGVTPEEVMRAVVVYKAEIARRGTERIISDIRLHFSTTLMTIKRRRRQFPIHQ
jgi:hypothetical protein